MKFFEQKIKGVFIIEAEPVIDDRGIFRRQFCEKEFADHGIANNISQANISENTHRHTIRGFHYQIHPFRESKTMTIIKGQIHDIILDLRKDLDIPHKLSDVVEKNYISFIDIVNWLGLTFKKEAIEQFVYKPYYNFKH